MIFKKNTLKNIALITSGSTARALIQAALLILIARNMSLDSYGALVAIISIISACLPLAALGYEFEVLNASSKNQDMQRIWSNFLFISLTTSLLLASILLPVIQITFPSYSDKISLCMLIFTEVFGARFSEGACRVFQGKENPKEITKMRILFASSKFICVIVAVTFIEALNIHTYAVACCVSTLISTALISRSLKTHYNISQIIHITNWKTFFTQKDTAISFFFDKLSANIDKILLARIISTDATATYAVAHRIADLLTIPMLSLITVNQPESFKNKKTTIKFKQLILPPLLYISVLFLPIYFFAEKIIVFALGKQYEPTAALLISYLFLPATSFIKFSLTTQLIATNKTKILLVFTILSIATNIIANLILIPIHGAQGAVIALFLSEAVVICFLLNVCLRYKN